MEICVMNNNKLKIHPKGMATFKKIGGQVNIEQLNERAFKGHNLSGKSWAAKWHIKIEGKSELRKKLSKICGKETKGDGSVAICKWLFTYYFNFLLLKHFRHSFYYNSKSLKKMLDIDELSQWTVCLVCKKQQVLKRIRKNESVCLITFI